MAFDNSGYKLEIGEITGVAAFCLVGIILWCGAFVEKETNGCLCGMGSTVFCLHPKLYMIKLKVMKAFRVCSSSVIKSRVRVWTMVNESVALRSRLAGRRLPLRFCWS